MVKQLRVPAALAVAVLLVGSAVAWAATINGTNGPDFLPGTSQSDRISAKAGADTVYGLRGNDRIVGSSGADVINGDGTCRAGAPDPDYCEDDETRGGNDRISAGSGNDVVQGGRGNDTIRGNRGNDELDGESGNDRVSGWEGDDIVRGGTGNDRLSGGSGEDEISGGSGNDRIFARDNQRDVIRCGPGFDRVYADRIDSVASDCERVTRGRSGVRGRFVG
jgi:Ca2+-binding RTX toxin-like protein